MVKIELSVACGVEGWPMAHRTGNLLAGVEVGVEDTWVRDSVGVVGVDAGVGTVFISVDAGDGASFVGV